MVLPEPSQIKAIQYDTNSDWKFVLNHDPHLWHGEDTELHIKTALE